MTHNVTSKTRYGAGKLVLDDHTFKQIAAIAYEEAGLAIAPSKAAMVHTRLARRLRALKLSSYKDYCALVESQGGKAERLELISALTTNVSHFFREDHHFDRLRSDVFPNLRKTIEQGGKVRIWSAGCSNGQEPYSIAMALLESGPLPNSADFKILASDIDPKVISFARNGIYDDHMISGLPEIHRTTFLTQLGSSQAPKWQVNPNLKKMVTFRELNLMQDWPMRGTFDVIFCRNVVIYFDEKTQDQLWRKFARVLSPGGWLFLGHSERVSDNNAAELPSVGMTAYRRAPFPNNDQNLATPSTKRSNHGPS